MPPHLRQQPCNEFETKCQWASSPDCTSLPTPAQLQRNQTEYPFTYASTMRQSHIHPSHQLLEGCWEMLFLLGCGFQVKGEIYISALSPKQAFSKKISKDLQILAATGGYWRLLAYRIS